MWQRKEKFIITTIQKHAKSRNIPMWFNILQSNALGNHLANQFILYLFFTFSIQKQCCLGIDLLVDVDGSVHESILIPGMLSTCKGWNIPLYEDSHRLESSFTIWGHCFLMVFTHSEHSKHKNKYRWFSLAPWIQIILPF